MAPPFVFPQILRALEEDPEDNHRLFAQNPVDVTSLRPSDLEEFVKGITPNLLSNSSRKFELHAAN